MTEKMRNLTNQYELLVKDTEQKYDAWECNPSDFELKRNYDLANEKEYEIFSLMVNEFMEQTNPSYRLAESVLNRYRKDLVEDFSKENS